MLRKKWFCEDYIPALLSFQHSEKSRRSHYDMLKSRLLKELVKKDFIQKDIIDQYQQKQGQVIEIQDDEPTVELQTLDQKVTESTEKLKQNLEDLLRTCRTCGSDSDLSEVVEPMISKAFQATKEVCSTLENEIVNEVIKIRMHWLTEEVFNVFYQVVAHMVKHTHRTVGIHGIEQQTLQKSSYTIIKNMYGKIIVSLFDLIDSNVESVMINMIRGDNGVKQMRFYFMALIMSLMCSNDQDSGGVTQPMIKLCERVMQQYYPKSFDNAFCFVQLVFHFVDMQYAFNPTVHSIEENSTIRSGAYIPLCMLNKAFWIVNRYQNYRFFTEDNGRIANVQNTTISYTPILFTISTQSLARLQQNKERTSMDLIDCVLEQFDYMFGKSSKHPAAQLVQRIRLLTLNEWIKSELLLAHGVVHDQESHVRTDYYRNAIQQEYLPNECSGSVRTLLEVLLDEIITYMIECCNMEESLVAADTKYTTNPSLLSFKALLVELSSTLNNVANVPVSDDEYVWLPNIVTFRILNRNGDKVCLAEEASVAQFVLYHFSMILGIMHPVILLTGGYHVDVRDEKMYSMLLKFAVYLIQTCGCLYPWSLAFVSAILRAIVVLTCQFYPHIGDKEAITRAINNVLESTPLFAVSIFKNWAYNESLIYCTINTYSVDMQTREGVSEILSATIGIQAKEAETSLFALFGTRSTSVYDGLASYISKCPEQSATAVFDAAIHLIGSSLLKDDRPAIIKAVSSQPWNQFDMVDKDFVIQRVIGQLTDLNQKRLENDETGVQFTKYMLSFFELCIQYHAITSNWDEKANNQLTSSGRVDVATSFVASYKSTVLKILEHWASVVLALFPTIALSYRKTIGSIQNQDVSWDIMITADEDLNLCQLLKCMEPIESDTKHELTLYNSLEADKQQLHVSIAWLRIIMSMSDEWIDGMFNSAVPMWKETLDTTIQFLKTVTNNNRTGLSETVAVMLYKNVLLWWQKVMERVDRVTNLDL